MNSVVPASPARIGIVDYLNTRPLAWGLRSGVAPPDIEAVFAPPARLADMLKAAEIEVGLVPVIETERLPGAQVIPGTCIAALREVRSVLLVSRRPIARVRRIALDENSRTSAALVRLLSLERWGIEPEFTAAAPDLDAMLEDADAALVIGDPALRIERADLQIWDLAAAWRAMTGLPFVFAVWTARAGFEPAPRLESLFCHSLEQGMAHLTEIVAQAQHETGLDPGLLHRYYSEHLHFELGAAERAGMNLFLERCRQHQLV
jgi:chorismate dehydratase